MRRRDFYRRQYYGEVQIRDEVVQPRHEQAEDEQAVGAIAVEDRRDAKSKVELRKDELLKKACPKCGAPGKNYYFHLRACKGDSASAGMAARPDK